MTVSPRQRVSIIVTTRPMHDALLTLYMSRIDTVLATYKQMQIARTDYRHSTDVESKNRVREALNAALKNLPEWPH